MAPSRRFLAGIGLLVGAIASAQAQESYVERIEVRVADIDVVVTDRDGNPLADLKREDFELYEDGRRVEIRYFSRIVEGLLQQEAQAAKVAEASPAPAPKVADTRAPVTWAVFVDQRNLQLKQRTQALRRLRAFFDRSMGPGDRALVATYDGMAFRVRGAFSTEKKDVLATLAGIERDRIASGIAQAEARALRNEVQLVNKMGFDGSGGPETGAISAQQGTLTDEDVEAQSNALAALRSLIDVMAGIEGRQAVVYVGTGFGTEFLSSGGDEPRADRHEARLENEFTDLLARASASRVTFYTIFAGDTGSGMSADETGSAAMGGPPNAAVNETLPQVAATRELADRTGGIAFKVNDDLDRQLEAVSRDLTHYYSLGYVPGGPRGRQRKLTVKVKVDGARVRYRETLRERAPDERANDAVVAALFQKVDANPLGISVDIAPSRRAGLARRLLGVTVTIPLSGLAFLRDGDAHRAGIAIHAALAAHDGTVWRLESREQPISIPQGELASALEKHVTYRFEIPEQAAGMRVAISVQDRLAPQVHSIVTVPVGVVRASRPPLP